MLHARGVITDDIEHVPGGKTFFWAGRYERDVNIRHTLQTDLNVFEHFQPKLSEASRGRRRRCSSPTSSPTSSARCASSAPARASSAHGLDEPVDRHRARVAAARRSRLVDCLILNDGELKQLTDEPNLVRAARAVLDLGPARRRRQAGRVRLGDVHARRLLRRCPPTRRADVVDPTGAGDTFAGGFMGYVAAHAGEEIDDELLRRAMAYGTALASFNVEAFGTERMQTLTRRRDRRARRRAAARSSTRFDARARPAPLASP